MDCLDLWIAASRDNNTVSPPYEKVACGPIVLPMWKVPGLGLGNPRAKFLSGNC